MRAQLYTAFPGIATIAVYTLRPTAAPSALFTAASVHEEFAGLAGALLEEHKHIAPTASAYPAAQVLQTYFPTVTINGAAVPIFCVKELKPAGILTDIDAANMLEVTRLRYQFLLSHTAATYAANSTVRANVMRALSYGLKQLFIANGIPLSFIPGDTGIRPSNGDSAVTASEVDFLIDFAPADARRGVDLPDPQAP